MCRTSSGDRMPSTTEATAGCAPAAWTARAGSVVPCSRAIAAVRRARSSSAGGACSYRYVASCGGSAEASRPEAKTPPRTTAVPARCAAGNSPSAAEASSRWYRPATRTTSRSNSSTTAVSGAVSFIPAPTARTSPSSRIRSSSGNAPARASSRWSSGSWTRATSTRSSPSRPRLSSTERRTPAAEKSQTRTRVSGTSKPSVSRPAPGPGTRSRPTFVWRTNSSRGRSRRAAPTRSSLRPAP